MKTHSLAALLALATAGCSPDAGLDLNGCLSKYRVYAAGTKQAVQLGYAACTRHVAGDTVMFNNMPTQCVLDGIGDIKTKHGVQVLTLMCREQ